MIAIFRLWPWFPYTPHCAQELPCASALVCTHAAPQIASHLSSHGQAQVFLPEANQHKALQTKQTGGGWECRAHSCLIERNVWSFLTLSYFREIFWDLLSEPLFLKFYNAPKLRESPCDNRKKHCFYSAQPHSWLQVGPLYQSLSFTFSLSHILYFPYTL